jgi:hypothetical protein
MVIFEQFRKSGYVCASIGSFVGAADLCEGRVRQKRQTFLRTSRADPQLGSTTLARRLFSLKKIKKNYHCVSN